MSRTWAAVVATAAVSVAATLAFVSWRDDIDPSDAQKSAKAANAARTLGVDKSFPPEIIDEQLARNRVFLGDDGVAAVRASRVAVIGAGGVGSWAATMLVRSGVGLVRIVDFDQVTLSSLNRHACATLADVGTTKADCLAAYLRRVAPWVDIEPHVALWNKERLDLLDGVDYVVDCIDNIDTKVDLLEHCHRNGINVVSSMGAGTKADPTRVQIADISQTLEDPLSRATRIRLRQRGIKSGITCIFSTEKPGQARLLDLDDEAVQAGSVDELSVLQNFRVRILPVLGPLPAILGLTIATHLLTLIGKYPGVYDPVQGGLPMAGKARVKLYETAQRSLTAQFARLKWPEAVNTAVTQNDVEYLIEEVWRGKTLQGQTNRLCLTIWDPEGPRSIRNIVPVTREQQAEHERVVLVGGGALGDLYPAETIELVNKRLRLDRWFETMR